MEKVEVYTKTKSPQRGSYLSFTQQIPFIPGHEPMFVTVGKKYKITDVVHINHQTGEKDFKFIDDKKVTDYISTGTPLFKIVEFFELKLVPKTEKPEPTDEHPETVGQVHPDSQE